MLRSLLFFVLFSSLIIRAESPNAKNSSFRFPWETYQDAVERHLNRRNLDAVPREKTAFSESQPIDKLDFSTAALLNNEAEIQRIFIKVRDERFIPGLEKSDFPRRSSWLYPADGCFARAALAGKRIESWLQRRPSKLFVFGTLKVNTPNSKLGNVSWWYHVVPIYRTDLGKVWVIDPAINPKGPMLVSDWYLTMGESKSIRGSVCSPYSYGPNDPCATTDVGLEKTALSDQENYLKPEWDNLVDLKRNPTLELGEQPPWMPTTPTRLSSIRSKRK